MTKINLQKGFTLIETIVYIGLFSIIMIGVLTSVYAILSGNVRNQSKAMVQEEGSFLIGKIDWVLSSITNATATNDGTSFSVTKSDTSLGNPMVVTVSGDNISIKRGSGDVKNLNNDNIKVSCPVEKCFIHEITEGEGINAESISASIIVSSKTLDGIPFSQEFSTVKFIRK